MTTTYVGLSSVAADLDMAVDALRMTRLRWPSFPAADVLIGPVPTRKTPKPTGRVTPGYLPGRVGDVRVWIADHDADLVPVHTVRYLGVPQLAGRLGVAARVLHGRRHADEHPLPDPDAVIRDAENREIIGYHPDRLVELKRWAKGLPPVLGRGPNRKGAISDRQFLKLHAEGASLAELGRASGMTKPGAQKRLNRLMER